MTIDTDVPTGGPWCDENMANWWVLAEDAPAALRKVFEVGEQIDPGYFGPYFKVWRVLIRRDQPNDTGSSQAIKETRIEAEDTVEAWHVQIGDLVTERRIRAHHYSVISIVLDKLYAPRVGKVELAHVFFDRTKGVELPELTSEEVVAARHSLGELRED